MSTTFSLKRLHAACEPFSSRTQGTGFRTVESSARVGAVALQTPLYPADRTLSDLGSRPSGADGSTHRPRGHTGLGVSGLGPGRSRDYSLELPQIRACTLNAPGSSRCGIAVPHTTGWFRGGTLVRHGVLGVVPTPRPQRGTPFAPRGPGGPFPRFNTTMGHCDSLPSISPRFVSFAWRYHWCDRVSSPLAPVAEPWINLELVAGISSRLAQWKRQGLPSSRRNPCDHSPYSSDPGVTRQAEWTMS